MKDSMLDRLLEKTPEEWQEKLHDEAAVNKYELDDEAAGQSQLYSNWASLAAVAHIYRKQSERDYEEIKAEAELNVRADPGLYGLEEKSPKEAAIKAVVMGINKVMKANRDFMRAYTYDKILSIAEKTFEGRKTMLRLEGDLWLGEYYSTTTIRDEQVDRFREKISDSKNRRKRRVKK